MKSSTLISFIAGVLLSYSSVGQEYSYTHYDITDGLAGSVVYCITQDKDGFIWVGTETGVSRFDGTHFKTFTVADGLPDIEVLHIFGDSKGRVWMAPFRKSICYYYRGKIHNQDNDSLLARVHLKENVDGFAEDADGNMLIGEHDGLYWFGADGKIREIDSIEDRPITDVLAISRNADGHFLVQAQTAIYAFSGGAFHPIYSFRLQSVNLNFLWLGPSGMIWLRDSVDAEVHSFATGKTVSFPFPYINYRQIGFGGYGDSLYYINETTGCKEYNLYTGTMKNYLPGHAVSKVFHDATGNTWFTTMGQGVFRLNSDEFKTIPLQLPGHDASSVYAILRVGDRLLVADNHQCVFYFSLPDMRNIYHRPTSLVGYAKNRVLFLYPVTSGKIVIATDIWARGDIPLKKEIPGFTIGIKGISEKNDSEIVIGSWASLLLVDSRKMKVEDTLARERTTAVYCRSDTVYYGTLNGLYRLDPDRRSVFLGKDIPFLKKRISVITGSPDGTLWVATYDAGLIGYRNGRVVATIDKQTGLTSDICRTMLVHDNALWVGTDKGLNKIALDKAGYPVIRYTSKDGLGSDMINSVYADGNVIYVGTPAGLSYFDQTKVGGSQSCRLLLLSILNSGKDRIGDTAGLRIPYRDKHVRFDFAAISYRSVGDIVYRYRMLGLDTAWQETRESFLEYPILPSGEYTLELQAVNKFGVNSNLVRLPVEVITPFWQKAWFDGLLLAAFLAITWFFVALRIRRIRRRQEEKERLNHRLAELENTALQSQMNPHFIFNCLNSIQQYVFDHEVLAANKYLTGFAKLIRATLHNSTSTFIPLSDEIDYLSTYLSLEKLRFKERMEYSIEVDPGIETDVLIIPPMLVQPFVENSMRHGLRHKTDGQGTIRLRFESCEGQLLVTVEDNGIGRKKASVYKTREHIEYQSKGMSLTADRIRTMNAKYGDDIGIEVHDLEDEKGSPCGTRVILRFPLFHTIPFQNDRQ